MTKRSFIEFFASFKKLFDTKEEFSENPALCNNIKLHIYINKVCAGVTNIDVYKNECRYFLVKRFTLKLNYPHFQNNYCNEKH